MQPGTNNRSKLDMAPRIAFEALHSPPETTHRQPNTGSKCQIACERCPKATNGEAVACSSSTSGPAVREILVMYQFEF